MPRLSGSGVAVEQPSISPRENAFQVIILDSKPRVDVSPPGAPQYLHLWLFRGWTPTGPIVLRALKYGSSGGPCEDNVTGLLVRSINTNWTKNSAVAVDAGILMSGICRILENQTTDKECKESQTKEPFSSEAPFVGLELPNKTSRANAAYIFREIISSVLITHPHLDHVAGLAMNTPAVEFQSGPKTVAALPSVIAALKHNIFNDITWPNLSDEDGGAGLVTYQRLVDGGNMRLGRGEGKGYVKVCDGLATKCMAVSHGSCKQRYNPDTGKHHRAESAVFAADSILLPSRRVSMDTSDLRTSFPTAHLSGNSGKDPTLATVESSVFFIRDESTGSEIIIFGDVEPDLISLEPRNAGIWEAAAPKIVNGILRAIFIECSYPNSVEDSTLYGHLCPRHLIQELRVLASKVRSYRRMQHRTSESRKRKRRASVPGFPAQPLEQALSPKSLRPKLEPPMSREDKLLGTAKSKQEDSDANIDDTKAPPDSSAPNEMDVDQPTPSEPEAPPLRGLRVYIIHVKESLADSEFPRDEILSELKEAAEKAALGCEFYGPVAGESTYI
ncbi:3',5'-cyclic-nucleotide phosphodiesterase pde1 [Ophidiomyces ophidiicola]|nr:3',5'-cyclic-nucleotide phosphodiesterase pde1 [Ophidiomyces ophidiicola]